MKDDDRFIFDLDTVNKFPMFPFSYDDINQNPYACVLINNNIMDLRTNCLTMDMMKNYEKYYGVCDSNEFSRRLNIFINGKNEKGLLNKIDWNHFAISGSVMPACAMKYNPLFDMYKTDTNEKISDNDLLTFFFHYYNNSDIDLICNYEKMHDFLISVSKIISDCKELHKNVTIDNVHTGTIVMSEDLLLYELDNIREILKDDKINENYVKANLENLELKKYFYDKYYKPWKIEKKEELKDRLVYETYKEYLELIPVEKFKLSIMTYEVDEDNINKKENEKYIYFNDIFNQENQENKLIGKLSESIRFQIKADNIKTFEVFKSNNKNYFSMISRFHMGFVRAYWNGTTVKCLPSFITSMMIQLATDYKYFASIRDPIEIVNKYRSRGFGIILNDYEKLHMAYYNSVPSKDQDNNIVNEKWIKMYNIDIRNKTSINSLFGTKNINSDVFKPSKFSLGLPNDCFKVINFITASTFEECFNTIIPVSLSSISKLKSIDNNGNIVPLCKDIIYQAFNDLNYKPIINNRKI